MNDGTLHLEIAGVEKRAVGRFEYVFYAINGSDSLGPIEITRRYKEFLYLRGMMRSRYPGLVIPPIPPKVWISNKAEPVVQERRRLLDLFLRQVCSISYLAQMPELQLFLRPNLATAIDSMRSLEKSTTEVVLSYYTERLPVSRTAPEATLVAYEEKTAKFIERTKTMYHEYVAKLKSHSDKMSGMKHRELGMFKDLSEFPTILSKLEGATEDRSTMSRESDAPHFAADESNRTAS